MRAVVFDGRLRFVADRPEPEVRPGWARVRVRVAGICRTDLEILKGYMGFRGVPGHEFCGTVESCADVSRVGRRVVGEINAACGRCDWCARGLGRHCPHRSVLGIQDLDGCMADCCTLPAGNLLDVPDGLPDDRAVFVEPLSAACEILEQVAVRGSERAVVLGDGRLGILCAWVLATVLPEVTLAGHHPEKLAAARWRGVRTAHGAGGVPAGADLVVEATGSERGLADALRLCRPRGTIVLKSTVASAGRLNLAPLVVREQTLVGSRCGRFRDGLRLLAGHPDMPLERLVTAVFPIEEAAAAFDRAARPDALKVLIRLSAPAAEKGEGA